MEEVEVALQSFCILRREAVQVEHTFTSLSLQTLTLFQGCSFSVCVRLSVLGDVRLLSYTKLLRLCYVSFKGNEIEDQP